MDSESTFVKRIETPPLIIRHSTYGARCFAFSSDGGTIATCDGKYISIWTTTGQQIRRLSGSLRPFTTVSFNHDDTMIAAGSEDKWIHIWDASSGELVQTLRGHTQPISSIAFSPDGSQLVSASINHDQLRLWNVTTGKLINKIGFGHLLYPNIYVNRVAFSPDGTQIAADDYKNIRIYNAETFELTNTLVGHLNQITSFAFSPDGLKIVSKSRDKTIKIWNVNTCQQLLEIPHTNNVHNSPVTFHPDGTKIVSTRSSYDVTIWNALTGKEIINFNEHTDFIHLVAFSPDGRKLVSSGLDDKLCIWNIKSPGSNTKPALHQVHDIYLDDASAKYIA